MPSPDPEHVADRFKELAETRSSPPIIAELRRLVERGSDMDCYKINAYRLAAAAGVGRAEALRTLLFAARLGIVDLSWDVHCPKCRGLPAYERHLMGMQSKAHCQLCTLDWEIDLADQVEVTFTVNPDLRAVEFIDFKDRDHEGKVRYFTEIVRREGREVDAWAVVFPGESGVAPGRLSPGRYRVFNAAPDLHPAPPSTILVADGPEVREPQRPRVVMEPDGTISPGELRLQPGPLELQITSRWRDRAGLLVFAEKPMNNWVSAAHVIAQQDFRDLFGGEFLAADVSFAVRSITLLFTDIKSSTEMYETLGDSKAYALVQEHFKLMTEAIRAEEGGIVKTIGDAVMAAFPVNAAAVRAAVEIQREFARQAGRVQGIQVKLGLHRGPAIAVTSNRALDYFGRMVNLAARVQGAAGAGEILATPAVFEDSEVRRWLDREGVAVKERTVALKGISDRYVVHDLVLPAGG